MNAPVSAPPQLIAATFRPQRGTITVFVEKTGRATATGELTLAEAQRLRDALDGALRIAANVDTPISAVAGNIVADRLQKKLLSLIGAIPAGEKLPLARFARELDASQAVVVSLIETMIGDGRILRDSLRPPQDGRGGLVALIERATAIPPFFVHGMSGDVLFAKLMAEAHRRGITTQQASLAIFRNKTGIYALRGRTPGVPTIEKCRAWLDAGGPERVTLDKLDSIGNEVSESRAATQPGETEASQASEAEVGVGCSADLPTPIAVPGFTWPLGDTPTGAELAGVLRRAARDRGVTVTTLLAPLGRRRSWLGQLEMVDTPKPATVARIRALLEGRDLPARHGEARAVSSAQRHGGSPKAELRESIAPMRALGERAAAVRKPGETLAAAVAREAQDAGERLRVARKFGNVTSPLESAADRFRRIAAEVDDEELGEVRSVRQAEADRQLTSPSALIRRATAEWPDLCGRVAAIAVEMGVGAGEAWRRVLSAGIDCLELADEA